MPYISDVGQPLLDQSQSFIVDTPQAASSSVKDNKISGGILLSEIEVEENSDWNVSLMIEIQRSSYELHVQPISKCLTIWGNKEQMVVEYSTPSSSKPLAWEHLRK